MSRLFDLLSTPIEDGVTVIEASAGTGKTYCLTGLVLRALLEQRVENAGQLLVVTFTNAATDELVGRIRATLSTARAVLAGEIIAPDPFLAGLAERYGIAERSGLAESSGDPRAGVDGAEILRHALLDIDDLTVATIHGFCKRVLDEAAFEGGLPFDVDLVESDEDLWLDAARDVWRRLLGAPELTAPELTAPELTAPELSAPEFEASLLPAVIAEKGLGPETYREDYRQWHRHPHTVLLPTPQSLSDAAADLAAARRAAAASFDRSRWRLALSRLEMTGEAELGDADRLRAVLAAADTFLRGRGEGLWALELLRADSLRAMVRRTDHAALERLPGVAELASFHQQLDSTLHAVRGHMLLGVERGFTAAKRLAATASFDDLLDQLHSALVHPSHGERLRRAVRSRYRLVLIDEFQDTDLVQYEIFRRLFGDGPLILVGDPKQAIYRFRGADVFAYLRAKRDADRALTLQRNWRSSEHLVAAVNAVFSQAPRPFVEEDIPFPTATAAPAAASRRLRGDDQAALVWLWLDSERQVARATERIASAVAQEVARLLDAGLTLEEDEDPARSRPLRPADVAILVRTNAQARLLQDRLREVGVPAVLSRTGDIFRSSELDEVLRLLDAVLEPTDGGRLRAACATVLWGDDAEALRALTEDDSIFEERVKQFQAYRDRWLKDGFISMMERLLQERGVRGRLAGLERGERRLTNLQHAVELAHQAAHDHHLSAAGLVAWLRAERRLEVHERAATELRLESDDAAVQLVTVHKSKGLEYEVVFCPFLWQARPIERAPVLVHETAQRLVYDCGSERIGHHVQMAEAERLAEDLRLTYVALTRARRRCYVVWGPIGRGPRSARAGLAWLLHRRQGQLQSGDGEPTSPSTKNTDTEDVEWIDSARRVHSGLTEVAERHDSWLGDLRELADRYSEVMRVQELDEQPATTLYAGGGAGENALVPLEASSAMRDRLQSWRIASFSSLTRGSGHETPDHRDPPSAPADSAPMPRGLFAFARGPRAGDCLHQIFEDVDYTDWADTTDWADSPESPGSTSLEVVRKQLRRFRLAEPEAHSRGPRVAAPLDPEAAVHGMLGNVLTKRLPGGLRLADVPRGSRLVEWQFYAPLALFAPAELADLFRRHAGAPWAEDYAERLAQLDQREVKGFLTGFIDVLLESGGRWWLVDWKSNHLGDRTLDYDLAAMTKSMIDHHYLLQAHLYALAVDRYLRLHVPSWDFRRDFGGIYYIFLRGVTSAPSRRSPSRDRPGRDRPGRDRPGRDRPGRDRPGHDRPGHDRPGRDRPGRDPARHGVSENQLDLFSNSSSRLAHDPDLADDAEPATGIFYLRPAPDLIEALGERLIDDAASPGSRGGSR